MTAGLRATAAGPAGATPRRPAASVGVTAEEDA